jgi:hypothetical protein
MSERLEISWREATFNEIVGEIKERRPEKIGVKAEVLIEDNLVKHVTKYNLSFRGIKEDVVRTETHLATQKISADPERRHTDALKDTITAFQRVERIKHGLIEVSPKTIIDGSRKTDLMVQEALGRKIKPHPIKK